MALPQPRNRWWRFVPRSRRIGFVSLFTSLLLIGVNLWALVARAHSGAGAARTVEAVIVVLAVLQFIRSVTGLAALRER
jgi:hypothetical protein